MKKSHLTEALYISMLFCTFFVQGRVVIVVGADLDDLVCDMTYGN